MTREKEIEQAVKDSVAETIYARYVDVFNVANGKEKKNMSLNVFASMIGKNFLMVAY